MEEQSVWVESQGKGRIGQNFVKTLLELSGYKVMDYGIENHNQEIIKLIKTNYKPDTNKRLLSMPDYVVVDPDTNESWLVEVKYQTLKESLDYKTSEIKLGYGAIKNCQDYWEDTTLVFVFNKSPFCVCVDVNNINWNVFFKRKFKNSRGTEDEIWNFAGLYQLINQKFPKVTTENFKKARQFLPSTE